jgi:MFS family permease
MQKPIRMFNVEYPAQYWLMLVGMLISTIGSSMIWPFLMIYASERLDLPMTAVASLLTINAAFGLVSSFIAGPIIDRVGRKWVMVISLFSNGIGYVFLSQATTLPVFAILMALQGASNPLYRVGADAMMADLIPPARRIDAYSILRLSNNLGIAIGPAIGGFLAATTYNTAFFLAAGCLISYGILLTFLARETLPLAANSRLEAASQPIKERFGGYGRVLSDRPFMSFAGTFLLTMIAATFLWVLLPVYSKANFNLSESRYGFIPMTNALMVVFLQIPFTQLTKRYKIFPILATGALFYTLGVASVALGRGFWGFWLSMVIITIGELIMVPTSSTFVANHAPPDMRGRYMSIYGLTWSVSSGIGPVFGGFLNDQFGPTTIWYGGGMVGMVSVLLFLIFSRLSSMSKVSIQPPPVSIDSSRQVQ